MLSNDVVDADLLSAGMLFFLTTILELVDSLLEVFQPDFTVFIELELELETEV